MVVVSRGLPFLRSELPCDRFGMILEGLQKGDWRVSSAEPNEEGYVVRVERATSRGRRQNFG